MSLRNRLLASYVALLILTFGIIAAALLVLLSAQPAPAQPIYQRLAGIIEGITLPGGWGANRWLLDAAMGDYDELGEIAASRDVRAVVIQEPQQVLLYDSAGQIASGTQVDYQAQTVSVQERRGPLARQYEWLTGSFWERDVEWLFVAVRGEGGMLWGLATQRPTQSFREALQAFVGALGLPMCQAGLVGLFVAFWLAAAISRSIARPLQTVAQAAATLSSGDLGVQVPVEGPPEVRSVGEAFNHMTAEVKASQNAQRDFLANVSHDLKTPLTSIQGFSQAIIDGAAKDPKHAAAIIHEEAERMTRMVAELTDLARIQAGRLSLKSRAVDLGQIAEAVAQRLSVVARAKGVTLHHETPSMPAVAGDGDRLAQVFQNLIGNAIKYTPSGGRVEVITRVHQHGVEAIVQDNGMGIPPQDLPRVFERFYQVDKTRGPERGTGLGLAIVREIVQAHGGRITVASEGENRGTTFTLWLPSPQLSTIARRR